MTDRTIPAALRTHVREGEKTLTAVPLCQCETPVRSLWHGDCSLCRGAILAADERPVHIAAPPLRAL